MGVGGQRYAPAALPPGRTRYPLVRRLLQAVVVLKRQKMGIRIETEEPQRVTVSSVHCQVSCNVAPEQHCCTVTEVSNLAIRFDQRCSAWNHVVFTGSCRLQPPDSWRFYRSADKSLSPTRKETS